MLFNQSKSEGVRTELNHLKSILYWHRPAGGLMEIISKLKETSKRSPQELDKTANELYIASLLGMGLEKSENKTFWIAKALTDPPDFIFMTITKDTKGRMYFSSREVEITRYVGDRTSKDLLQTLLDKDKNYPEDYIIVCFLETTGIEDLKKISEQLMTKLKNITHVFVVFHGLLLSEFPKDADGKILNSISLVQLAPIFDTQSFNLIEKIEEWKTDECKLVYVEGRTVFYGKRKPEEGYPKIL